MELEKKKRSTWSPVELALVIFREWMRQRKEYSLDQEAEAFISSMIFDCRSLMSLAEQDELESQMAEIK